MNPNAYSLLLRRAVFWLAAFFAVGSLTAYDYERPFTYTIIDNAPGADQHVYRVYFGIQSGSGSPYYPTEIAHEAQEVVLKRGETITLTFNEGWDSSEVVDPYIPVASGVVWCEVSNPTYTVVGNSRILTGGTAFEPVDGQNVYYGAELTFTNTGLVGPQVNPDTRKTIWVVDDETLTADLYREGVDKTIAFLQASVTELSSGSAGATSENQALYYDQQARITNQTDATTDANAIRDGLGVEALKDAAVADTLALMPTFEPGAYTEPSGGSADFLEITMPETFGGAVVNFNPFTPTRLGPLASWFRYATQWLVYALLAMWVVKEFQEWLKAYASTNQADGRPVFAGTGGQASALVNAGIITAAIIIAITALVAYTIDGINVASLLTSVSSNPLLGMGANAYWFLDQMFPLSTILACFVARIAFMIAGNTIYATLFTVIRFCIL